MQPEALKLFDVAVQDQRMSGLQVVRAHHLLHEGGIRPKVVAWTAVAQVEVAEDDKAIRWRQRDPRRDIEEMLEGRLDRGRSEGRDPFAGRGHHH